MSDVYKKEIVEFVENQKNLGRSRGRTLESLEISSSTYYSWKKAYDNGFIKVRKERSAQPNQLTPGEKDLILKTKEENPLMRYRQIQGVIQGMGVYISESSVYKILKTKGLVEPFERRESPWKTPKYEIISRNLMWGTDWTKIKIGFQTWQLITLIDFFSRKIIAWDIQPNVNAGHMKAIYTTGLKNEDISHKPKLRADQGSPNKAYVMRDFMKDIGADLSFARVRRPTDNAITERFYGTIKQEEIFVVGSYPDEISAREEIEDYIDFYNEDRPHQALWNFTPNEVHEVNNKSEILARLAEIKFETKRTRKEYWGLKKFHEAQKMELSRLTQILEQGTPH